MVNGLDYFLSQLADFKDHFILIGGAACDLWMGSLGLPSPESVLSQIRENFGIVGG